MRRSHRDLFAAGLRARGGRKSLRNFRRFIGVKTPPEILHFKNGPKETWAGMGRVPEITVWDGRRKKRIAGHWLGAFNPRGTRILLIKKKRGLPVKSKWRKLGRVVKTHYILTRGMERMGSFKRGKHWVHEHKDEGGKWPMAYVDQNGNVLYGRGTYRIGKWIRR